MYSVWKINLVPFRLVQTKHDTPADAYRHSRPLRGDYLTILLGIEAYGDWIYLGDGWTEKGAELLVECHTNNQLRKG